MWLGFRIANSWFQRPPFLLHSCIRCKLESSTSLLSSQSSTCNEFLPWLQRKAGTEISFKLSIGNSIYGRSLFASTFIQAGDCILKVPFSVQLTPDNVLPEIRFLLGDNVGNVARLAIVLLVERKRGQDSEWAPYVGSLPQAGELHSTIFWSKKELEMVGQSPVYKETINQQTQIENEFMAIRPALDRFPQFFEDIKFEDFVHAYALVGSRAWGSSKGLSLIPFADFLNHDGHTEAILLGDEHKQTSEVIADRDYAPGEQVLIRYGKFPNSTLLVDFGFTISYNTYDQVLIWLSIPEHDPLHILKLELLDKHRMITDTNSLDSSGHSFIIKEVRSTRGKGKGIPQSLRAFVRVLSSASPQELKDLDMEAANNDGRLARRPLKDIDREIQAHKILRSQIVHLIQEYDASIKAQKLRPLNLPSIDGQLALRRRMAFDLLAGELRVLKSAYAWLTNYCYTLSAGKPGDVHPLEPGCFHELLG